MVKITKESRRKQSKQRTIFIHIVLPVLFALIVAPFLIWYIVTNMFNDASGSFGNWM